MNAQGIHRISATMGGMAVGLLAGALLWAHAAPPQAKPARTVRAQAFELVDGEGKTGAMLGWDAKGWPSLRLLDLEGRTRATLTTTKLALQDEKGRERVQAITYDNYAGVILQGNDDTRSIRLFIDDRVFEGGFATLTIIGKGGQPTIGLNAGPKQNGALVIGSAAGRASAGLAVNGEGGSELSLTGPNRGMIRMGLGRRGQAYQQMEGAQVSPEH